MLTASREILRHLLHLAKNHLRLITALVEETAKGIRKLKIILLPRRNENG